MRFQLFQFPLPWDGDLSDLNQFIATHGAVSVSQSIVRVDSSPLLIFVVEHLSEHKSITRGSDRVDYREKFNPEEFAMFSQLREERKKIAEEGGVPVYTILTNAQLADIVVQKVRAIADLETIPGIGKARIEKFGARLIDVITRFHATETDAGTSP